MASPPRNRGASDPGAHPDAWRSFHTLLISLFMLLIDVTIVAVAVPSIQRDLHATYAQVELVLAIYQVGFAVILITGGRLGDIYGRKRVLDWGMAGFMVSSAACGLAPGVGFLILMRVVQGLFAALMYPQIYAFAQELFPGPERRQAFATLGAVAGMGVVAGPLLGGLLLQWNLFNLHWRPIFLINVFIGAYALAAGRRRLRECKAEHPPRLDGVGAGLAALWIFLLVWPVTVGPQAGWPRADVLMLLAVAPLIWLFLRFEARHERGGGDPLVSSRLLRNRGFRAGLACDLFVYLALPAFVFMLFVVLQIGLAYSALGAALATLPYALGELAGALGSERLVQRWGKGVLYLGTSLAAAGLYGLRWTFRWNPQATAWDLLPALAVLGCGWGLVAAPLANIILSTLQGEETGAGSGILTTVQRVGGAVGIGLASMFLFGGVAAAAPAAAAGVTAPLHRQLKDAGLSSTQAHAAAAALARCFVQRARSSDPIAPPPGCRTILPASRGTPAGSPQASALRRASRGAEAHSFAQAFAATLWYEIAMFLAALCLAWRLPRPDPRRIGQAD